MTLLQHDATNRATTAGNGYKPHCSVTSQA